MILSSAQLHRHRNVVEGRATFAVRGVFRVWVELLRDGNAMLWLSRSAHHMRLDGSELRASIRLEGYPMDVRVWREPDVMRDGKATQDWRVEFDG